MQERPTNQRGSDDDNDLGADIEGLGVFYLGKRVDPDSGKPGREPLLLPAPPRRDEGVEQHCHVHLRLYAIIWMMR